MSRVISGRMVDGFDRVLAALQRHRAAVLGFSGAVIVLVGVAFALRDGGSSRAALPAGTVALVGDRTISQTTFDHWAGVYRRSGAGGANPTPALVTKAVLQILVAASWTEQEAARLNVSVTNAQVAAVLKQDYATAKAQGVTKARMLQQVGGSENDLRWEVQMSLLGQALQTRAANAAKPATGSAIAARYAAEPERWAKPSRRDLEIILTTDSTTAAKALVALRAGASFSAVAKRYDRSNVRNPAATLTNVRPGTRDPAFERAVFAATVGRLTGPTQVGSGWIVFRVKRSTPLAAIPLSRATGTLRSELTAAAQSTAVGDYLRRFRAAWRARTRCARAVADTKVCASSA